MRIRYKVSSSGKVFLGTLRTYRRRDKTSPWYLYETTYYEYDPVLYGKAYSSWLCTKDALHKGPPYKIGGPFDSVKLNMKDYLTPCKMYGKLTIWPNQYQVYEGGMLPAFYPAAPYILTTQWTQDINSTLAVNFLNAIGDGTSRGPAGYEKFSPVKPEVDLGQLLAEVREIPRMFYQTARHFQKLWISATRRYKCRYSMRLAPNHVAAEWLNTQFGWLPFVSTVRDFYETTSTLSRKIERLRKYNGKWERRGGLIFEERSNPTVVKSGTAGVVPQLSTYFGATATRPYTLSEIKSEKTWFSAQYKYYIPELADSYIEKSRFGIWQPGVIKHLYGLDLTPSLLWQIMPWTWLTDWVFNVTKLLEANEDPYGQCVSKNAWVMSTQNHDFVFETTVPLAGTVNHGTWQYSTSRKQRKGATHYGFDVPYSGLSPWKLSILLALGLSKSRIRWQAGG